MKGIYENPTANIIITGETLTVPPKIRNKFRINKKSVTICISQKEFEFNLTFIDYKLQNSCQVLGIFLF